MKLVIGASILCVLSLLTFKWWFQHQSHSRPVPANATYLKQWVSQVRDLSNGQLVGYGQNDPMTCPEGHACRFEGDYIFWRGPAQNAQGICAEVYSNYINGHYSDSSGPWSGEYHRDGETKAYFKSFQNQSEAEHWGDSVCPSHQ